MESRPSKGVEIRVEERIRFFLGEHLKLAVKESLNQFL